MTTSQMQPPSPSWYLDRSQNFPVRPTQGSFGSYRPWWCVFGMATLRIDPLQGWFDIALPFALFKGQVSRQAIFRTHTKQSKALQNIMCDLRWFPHSPSLDPVAKALRDVAGYDYCMKFRITALDVKVATARQEFYLGT